MKFEDRHKQFVVKSYAKMMTRTEITEAFMQEFEHDLPKPSMKKPEYPTIDIEQEYDKQAYTDNALKGHYESYQTKYGDEAETKYNQDLDTIRQQVEDDFQRNAKQHRDETYKKELQAYDKQLDDHNRKLRADISNRLRVYNISHSRFPLKYRQIYDQTQREYLSKLLTNPNTNEDQVTQELQTLYGFIKRRIIQGESTRDLSSDIKLAHTILKTIATTKS